MSGVPLSSNQASHLHQTRVSELKLIKSSAYSVKSQYSASFNSEFDIRMVPIMKLYYDKSSLNEPFKSFWANSRVFDSISPVWDTYIMKSGFHRISSMQFSEEIIFAIQDFLKGRFIIMSTTSRYIEVKPKLEKNLQLFGLLIVESYPEVGAKVLVCGYDESTKSANISSAFKEVEMSGSLLCGLDDLGENPIRSVVSVVNDGYAPSPTLFETIERMQQRGVRPLSFLSKPKTTTSIENPAVNESVKSLLKFSKNNLPPELVTLSQNVERLRTTFLKKTKQDLRAFPDWIDLLVNFHCHDPLAVDDIDFYQGLGVEWSIVSFNQFCSTLRVLGDQQFLHYFHKIIRFSQGFLIENLEYFSSVNNEKRKPYLIAPLMMEEFQLRPILTIVYFDTRFEEIRKMPKLGIIGWWDFSTMKACLEEVERNFFYILDVRPCFGRDNLKSLVIFSDNLRILPLKNLKKENKNDLVNVFFCANPPGVSKDTKFQIIETGTSKEIMFAESKKIKTDQILKMIHLVSFNVSKNYGYRLKFGNHSFFGSFNAYFEKVYRNSGSSSVLFLFDVDFQQSNASSSQVSIPVFRQLTEYSEFILESYKNELIYYLCLSFSAVKTENIQENDECYLTFLENHINTNQDMNLESFIQITCFISLTKSFPFYFFLPKIQELMGFFINYPGNILDELKSRPAYKFIFKGISKVIISATLNQQGGLEVFEKISDYIILKFLLQDFIKEYKKAKKFIETGLIQSFLSIFERVPKKDKEILTFNFIHIISDLAYITYIMIQPSFAELPVQTKREFLSNLFITHSFDNNQILNFLSYFNENFTHCQEIFDKSKLVTFLQSHLEKISNCQSGEIFTVRKIVLLIKGNQFFKDFKHDPVIQTVIQTSSFAAAMDLIEGLGLNPTDYFLQWINSDYSESISNHYRMSHSFSRIVAKVDQELMKLQENLQIQLVPYFFSIFEEGTYLKYAEFFTQVKCVHLKNNYLKNFKDIISRTSKVRSDFMRSYSSRQMKNNEMMKEIYIFAICGCSTSEEELYLKLLVNPSENDGLYSFFADFSNNSQSESYKTIKSYILKIASLIKNEKITYQDLRFIYKQNTEKRKAFKSFIQIALNDSKENGIFLQLLGKCLDKFKKIFEELKILKLFIFKYTKNSLEFKEIKNCFYNFHKKLWKQKISVIDFPELLENLIKFLKANSIPLSSLMFLSFTDRISSFSELGNFIFNLNRMIDYLFLIQYDKNKTNTKELSKYLKNLETENLIQKETSILSSFFKDEAWFQALFPQIASDLRKFLIFKDLLESLDSASEYLSLSSQLKEKISSIPNFLSPDFQDFLIFFNNNTLSGRSLEEIDSLSSFFRSFSEYKRALILADSLQEDEISFWQECFQETSENKKLTIDLIQKFSNIWSFLHLLKNSKSDLFSLFQQVLDSFISPRYKNFIEDLGFCDGLTQVLEDYNKSLNNQEQVKLTKIKSIVFRSKYRISFQDNLYVVALFMSKENDDFDLNFLSLHDLQELRDRALLSKYIIDQKSNSQEMVQDIETYEKFVKFVDKLGEFIEIINRLSQSLYRDVLNVQGEFFLNKGDLSELMQYWEYYKYLLEEQWKVAFREISKKNYWINFLNGERILMIDRFVFSKTEQNLARILPILRYMQKNHPPLDLTPRKAPEEMTERLKILENELASYSKLEFQLKLDIPGVELKPKPEGQLILIESKEYYKAILSIYAIYENSVPTVDLVFFCYLSSSWQELKIFINRCFLNESLQIYTLVFPENLSLENQMKLESKIIKNFQVSKKLLAIVTNNTRSKIVNNLRYQKEIQVEKINSYLMLKDQQVTEILRKLAADIEVVSSKSSGLGKSSYIQMKSRSVGRPIIEIDVSGSSESSELGCQLESVSSPFSSNFHVQVSFLADAESFEHLIFSLSVFKQHYSHKSLFVLPDDSGFFIEVANTFKNRLFDSLPFLRLLPRRKFLRKLDLSKLEITENLVYVSNYLQHYDSGKIDKIDLNFQEASQVRPGLEAAEIGELLKRHFFEGRLNESNFHQLTNFIKILTTLLKNFEKSMFCASLLQFQMQDLAGTPAAKIFRNIRSSMVQSMIETTKEFTTKCTDNVLSGQNQALKKEEDSKEEVQNLADCSIKWENSNHFITLFLKDGDFLCIYREAQLIPRNIRKMIFAQQFVENCINKGRVPNMERVVKQYMAGTGEIKEYSSFSSEQLIDNLVTFYIKNSLRKQREQRYQAIICTGKELDLETMKKQRIRQLVKSGYILTPDNFLKMNLIYLRCISNLPLIIMGETGCGKTSLLRFFIEEVLQENLEIIYIHSGITIDHIRKKLTEANILAQKALVDRVWVFFDEFNTSDLIGVIVNVLCERKFENLNLSPKLICVGACNPYRVKSVVTYQENVGIKKKIGNSQLVHVVKPLPDKAIEFVWDFGALKHQEIRDYVQSMLRRVITEGLEMFVELVCAAHEHFQTSEDLSSVSLRDVNRFIRLNRWFVDSMKTRKTCRLQMNDLKYNLLKEEVAQLDYLKESKGTFLAFFHCYLLRISSSEQRELFLDVVMTVVSKYLPLLKQQLKTLLQFEQLDFILRMSLPEGIALNQALTENIFAILPCLMNQIPIFICGKPGCSKSLAIQIISSSVRGDKSFDTYLKTLPELQIVSFQGSDSCTSEGVEEVFNKAEKMMNYSKQILPVVLFDEIGLAEVSRYNPLKVLHRLLEAENCRVGFIAISNWRLDASKMNRALYLARPDPEQEDLVNTATTLFESLAVKMEETRVKRLADGYFEIKQLYSQTPLPDFYGLRDFYHMIKFVGKQLNFGRSLDESVQVSLQRNFNGLEFPLKVVRQVFDEFFYEEKMIPVVQLIQENLRDKDARYLMIICARDVSIYLQSTLIQQLLPNSRLIIGSTLEKDVLQESTRFRVLSDIIGFMEQGIPIVLQDMDIIYSSLYDLFNQNFTKLGNLRRYCRIALGAQFNPKCFVNDSFKAVVFLDNDEETLKSTDAPFLNRFEKHFVVLSEILSEDCLQLSEKVRFWIQQIMKINSKENRLDPVAVFPCYSEETVNLFIKLNEDKSDLETRCKKFWIQNASMDLLLLCKINNLEENEKQELVNHWKNLHSLTFTQYLETLFVKKQVKMISATYDHSSIDYLKGEKQGLQIEKCSNFKSEEDLKKSFSSFMSGLKIIYLFELDYSKEQQHLRFIVNLFERVFKELEGKVPETRKNIVVLIRMGRNDENRLPLCLFQGWKYKMFEDLQMAPAEVAAEILELDTKTIVANEKLFKFEENVGEISQQAVETLVYTSNFYSFDYLLGYKNAIQQGLTENSELVQVFKRKILVSIGKFLNKSREKWDLSLFTSEKIIHQALSVKDALRIYVYEKFFAEFTKLIILCEKKSALSPVISLMKDNYFFNYWANSFDKLNASDLQVQLIPESNQLRYTGTFILPFLAEDFKTLQRELEELKEQNLSESDISNLLRKFYTANGNWKSDSDFFYSSEVWQLYFIRDYLESVLIEQDQGNQNIESIYNFTCQSLSQYNQQDRIYKLLDSQEKILNLNKIFLLYSELSYCSNLSYHLNSHLMVDLPFPLKTRQFFESLIKETPPFHENLSKMTSLKEYSRKLSIFQGMILNFSSEKPENIHILDFWIQLARLMDKEMVLGISWKAYSEGFEALFEYNHANDLLASLNSNSIPELKFKVFYFDNLLKRSSNFTRIVAEQINFNDFWKYSGPILDSLLVLTDLESLILASEANPSSFLLFLNEKNDFLNELSVTLSQLDLKSTFSVLLSDKISQIQPSDNFKSFKDSLRFYMKVLENDASSEQDKNLRIIVASGRIRCILRVFVNFISDPQQILTAEQDDMVKAMKDLLVEKKILQYELFLLKEMKTLAGDTLFRLSEKVKQVNYPWKHDVNGISIKSNLPIFPYLEANGVLYKQIVLKLAQISSDMESVNHEISESRTPSSKLTFGLALINQIYLSYKLVNFDPSPFKSWFLLKQNLILHYYGPEFSILVNLLINNFPVDSLLHISPSMDELNFIRAQMMITSIMIAFAYQAVPNPFSSLFFDSSGQAVPDIAGRLNSFFAIGAQVGKMQDYIKYMRDNYETLKSTTFNTRYSKGGSYVCSNTCDYLYIVNNCGGTTEKKPCPFCGLEIGGVGHRQVEREGHRNLNDQEARAYLNAKCEEYQAREKRGLNISGNSLILAPPRKMRMAISYYFLNLAVNSTLYFFAVGLGKVDELSQVYSVTSNSVLKVIQDAIKDDFREISNVMKGENLHYWTLSCILKLIPAIENNISEPRENSIRLKFESDFEQYSTFQDSQALITSYKASLSSQLETSPLSKYLEELECPPSGKYPYSDFFRVTSVQSWEKLARSFNQSPRKQELRTLHMFLENFEETLNLSHFWPILKFTQDLISEFSFKISRKEASVTPIKEALKNTPNLLPGLQKFLRAWDSLSISLNFDCKTFNKVPLDESSSISYFLVDNDINSQGIFVAAALRSLGDLQNRIRGVLNEEGTGRLFLISHLSQNDIFSLDNDFLEGLAISCSSCRSEYGRGKEVFYDYDRVQLNIEEKLSMTKLVDTQKLQTIQYQYELLNARSKFSGIIQQIREAIPQETISEQDFQNIERNCKAVAGQHRVNHLVVLNEVYSWLNRLLSIVLQQNLEEVKVIRKMNFFNLRFNSKFKADELVSDLPISKITSLFEMIEVSIYPHVVKNIGEQFKFDVDQQFNARQIIQTFKIAVSGQFGDKAFQESHFVIRRIACRLLTANIDQNFLIRDYFAIENYWSLAFVDRFESIAEYFPAEFRFMHAVQVEAIFDEIGRNQVQEKDVSIRSSFSSNSRRFTGKIKF